MMTDNQNHLPAIDDVEDSNTSNNPEFANIISRRINRRGVLKGGTGLTAAAFFGTLPLVGCGSDSDGGFSSQTGTGNSDFAQTCLPQVRCKKFLSLTSVPCHTTLGMT